MNIDLTIKRRFALLLSSAKQRKIKVNLNIQVYSDLIDLGCAYCGQDLKKVTGYSIDRLDSKLGYVLENCTPCCKTCNLAKGSMSNVQFIDWIEKAYKFQIHIKQELDKLQDLNLKKQQNIYLNKSSVKTAKTYVYNP